MFLCLLVVLSVHSVYFPLLTIYDDDSCNNVAFVNLVTNKEKTCMDLTMVDDDLKGSMEFTCSGTTLSMKYYWEREKCTGTSERVTEFGNTCLTDTFIHQGFGLKGECIDLDEVLVKYTDVATLDLTRVRQILQDFGNPIPIRKDYLAPSDATEKDCRKQIKDSPFAGYNFIKYAALPSDCVINGDYGYRVEVDYVKFNATWTYYSDNSCTNVLKTDYVVVGQCVSYGGSTGKQYAYGWYNDGKVIFDNPLQPL